MLFSQVQFRSSVAGGHNCWVHVSGAFGLDEIVNYTVLPCAPVVDPHLIFPRNGSLLDVQLPEPFWIEEYRLSAPNAFSQAVQGAVRWQYVLHHTDNSMLCHVTCTHPHPLPDPTHHLSLHSPLTPTPATHTFASPLHSDAYPCT